MKHSKYKHLSNESVDVASLGLPEAIDAKDRLNVMSWIPGRIENDDAIGSYKIDPK